MKITRFALLISTAVVTFVIGTGAYGFVSWVKEAPDDYDECTEDTIAPTVMPPAVTVAAEPVFEPVVAESEQEESCDFTSAGSYAAIRPFGKKFEGFEGFWFETEEWDEKSEKSVPIKPRGSVYWKKEELRLVSVVPGRKEIVFETAARQGVRFKFVGRFVDESIRLKDSETGEYFDQPVNVKGTLIRFDGRKKTSETLISFAEECGC